MSSLRDRLENLRAVKRAGPASVRRAPPPALPGWEEAGEFVFRRTDYFPLPDGSDRGLRSASGFFLDGADPGGLLWYDTETTGLSGGAGTTAFLAGFAGLDAGRIRLTQFFLADFPGEPELLRLAAGECSGRLFMISYNGRAFDAPLLRTRFVMNRIPADLPAQFDLLYPARRLWRRVLPDCALGTVEGRVLGRERKGDVPGALIPGLYFEYLAKGDPEPMLRVAGHNRQDILSLVDLFVRIGGMLEDPSRAETVDTAALGALLLGRHPERGLPLLRRAAGDGDPRALLDLSRYYKRNRLWRQAEELWRAAPPGADFARLELAKLCEHRLGAFEEALAITEDLLDRPGPAGRGEPLARRRERLLEKIRRRRLRGGF